MCWYCNHTSQWDNFPLQTQQLLVTGASLSKPYTSSYQYIYQAVKWYIIHSCQYQPLQPGGWPLGSSQLRPQCLELPEDTWESSKWLYNHNNEVICLTFIQTTSDVEAPPPCAASSWELSEEEGMEISSSMATCLWPWWRLLWLSGPWFSFRGVCSLFSVHLSAHQ